MKIKEITFYKEYKHGLPNYSNITASMSVTVEAADDEKIDKQAVWEEINNEIFAQATLDPQWIEGDEGMQKRAKFLESRKNMT